MNKILSFLFIFCLIAACKTQSTTQKTALKSAEKTAIPFPKKKIEDVNKIWGAYILTPEDMQILEKQKLSKATIQNIVAFSHESTWPLALQNMTSAAKRKEIFALYNTYLISSQIDEPDLSIYYVPFAQNSQMPDSLLLDKEDFYVIVKK